MTSDARISLDQFRAICDHVREDMPDAPAHDRLDELQYRLRVLEQLMGGKTRG